MYAVSIMTFTINILRKMFAINKRETEKTSQTNAVEKQIFDFSCSSLCLA